MKLLIAIPALNEEASIQSIIARSLAAREEIVANSPVTDVLGFLDADGTCEPRFFAPLCDTLVAQNADVVLGCRLNEKSRMPVVRRIGNGLFASMLSVLSSTRVRDT